MPAPLNHDLKLTPTRDESARQDFVGALRKFVLVDLADDLKRHYQQSVAPRYERELGQPPEDGVAVHKALRNEAPFKFYSSLRYNAQEMVWRSVAPTIDKQTESLGETFTALRGARTGGTLELDPDLPMPDNVTAVDVHLMPGSYHTETGEHDISGGALYDNGLAVFSFGVMGRNLDDIGMSMSNYVKATFPDLTPAVIVDVGCTIGHNSVPWAQTFPQAKVYACDVAAPGLRYGHARAQSQGVPVHFRQMSADDLKFDDASVDVVFNSMFLHELPVKTIRQFMAEAFRVLKPGGVFITMELPPNDQMSPYDAFYLDWDSYYNNEPFYKTFRDQSPTKLMAEAGFPRESHFEAVMPRYTYTDEAAWLAAIRDEKQFDSSTGRLADTINWYCFGARK